MHTHTGDRATMAPYRTEPNVRLFKVLHPDGRACHGGTGTWHLPTQAEGGGQWEPGEWTARLTGDLLPCSKGYHLCRAEDLLTWLTSDAYAVFDAEAHPDSEVILAKAHPDSEVILAQERVVVRQARLLRRLRWDARIARLFACDCAERVLKYCDPDDRRPREAIAAARRYAEGQATQQQLAAAWDAIGVAPWAAAGDAARAAAGATAQAAAGVAAWVAAWAAAGAAARAAAGATAQAAAWDAAWAAERGWQTNRLLWYLDGQPVAEV
jgi:hypothetical protein